MRSSRRKVNFSTLGGSLPLEKHYKMQNSKLDRLSTLLRELNDYSYIPHDSMISKLKFFYGPYNQVKGFRKFMDLPKSPFDSGIKSSEELWENLTSYIIEDKEATLR